MPDGAAPSDGTDRKDLSFSDIPCEIFSQIAAFLSAGEAALYRRVSKAWSKALIMHQYSRVALATIGQCEAFLDEMERNPSRVDLVRQLCITQPGYAWLLDHYDITTRIIDLVGKATTLHSIALDSALRGIGSLSFDPTCMPPFFVHRIANAMRHPITYLHVATDYLHNADKVAWWAKPTNDYADLSTANFVKVVPELRRMAFIITRPWLANIQNNGIHIMVASSPPCCTHLAIEHLPVQSTSNLPRILAHVPAHMTHVHLRGAIVCQLDAVCSLARPGRTVEINVGRCQDVQPDVWEGWMEAYRRMLTTSEAGAVLRVFGFEDWAHKDVMGVSHDSCMFADVVRLRQKTETEEHWIFE
ncbi:hypothetical protein HKX48_004426 [Thoreauomyces humboldtii]|nr:hypothetical protein HKX48_004426 [Thoreauomyces humboldtii]